MQGEVRRLKQVFNSFMEIPIYQRNYDWKIAQCERLFDDLIYARTKWIFQVCGIEQDELELYVKPEKNV